MEQNKDKNITTKTTSAKDGINYDYDYNTEYGDGDIPDIDKGCYRDYTIPSEISYQNEESSK